MAQGAELSPNAGAGLDMARLNVQTTVSVLVSLGFGQPCTCLLHYAGSLSDKMLKNNEIADACISMHHPALSQKRILSPLRLPVPPSRLKWVGQEALAYLRPWALCNRVDIAPQELTN